MLGAFGLLWYAGYCKDWWVKRYGFICWFFIHQFFDSIQGLGWVQAYHQADWNPWVPWAFILKIYTGKKSGNFGLSIEKLRKPHLFGAWEYLQNLAKIPSERKAQIRSVYWNPKGHIPVWKSTKLPPGAIKEPSLWKRWVFIQLFGP